MTVITDKIQNKTGGPVELGKQVAAKMWANYDGVNATVRDSFNLSSSVDLGSGHTEFNMTSGMSDANYCTNNTCKYLVNAAFGNNTKAEVYGKTAGVVNSITMSSSSGNNIDCQYVYADVLGELAQ
ncbi:hypothetical protein [Terasakiella pusilla]|uniref:hypothetical protein n=1 Tax=Terasakiella pusilla TaxID=64973 RepID=UPI003AA7CB1C